MHSLSFLDESAMRSVMNELGERRTPFLFVISFLKNRNLCIPLQEIDPEIIRYAIPGKQNGPINNFAKPFNFSTFPIDFASYKKKFEFVKQHIQYGNTYLINFTQPTRIETNLSLYEIFMKSTAPYKLWIKDLFCVFSPEIFVKVKNDKIYSYPMKGTMEASIDGAEQILTENPKEKAEHYTIVDLIRNDLSMISERVVVERFMYLVKVKTHKGELWQAISRIRGTMPQNWRENLGNWFLKLLPAGSISGAPKKKTIEIILEAEGYERGFYTGVFGIFDGYNLDSAVMIRYIEKTSEGLVFKSGGGITHLSDPKSEYEEMVRKVYLPFES